MKAASPLIQTNPLGYNKDALEDLPQIHFVLRVFGRFLDICAHKSLIWRDNGRSAAE